MTLQTEILAQLDDLIEDGNRLEASYRYGEMAVIQSDLPEAEFRAFAAKSFAAIARIAGLSSEYFKCLPDMQGNDALNLPGYSNTKLPAMIGSLTALRHAVDNGYLVALESRLRANIHSDFLEQAKSLLDTAFHVAAMVLIGGVLEDHLHKLCVKRGLTWKGAGSISKYNDQLHGHVYDKPIWRRIQAIGDSRNDAAHGQGANVQAPDVEDAYTFVGRFIVDYPA